MMPGKALWFLVAFSIVLEFSRSRGVAESLVSVDPPIGLKILDPGHLGQLHVTWTLPVSLRNVTNCTVRFQLHYFNTYENSWRAVRTTRFSYSAQFDLEKEAHVRVQTLLRGPCTNQSGEVQSQAALTSLKPQTGGIPGSKVEGFICVFYLREYMECTWDKRKEERPHSQYHLYYWQRGMEQAEECHNYILSHGVRSGCNFSHGSILEFTEFNICVNGSLAGDALQSAHFSLQIQNHVKPAAIETPRLEYLSGDLFRLEWTPSPGRIPRDCLEFEVESRLEGTDAPMERNITRVLSYIIIRPNLCKRPCLRIRSRVHKFCADRSFWSDWSTPICLPEPSDCSRSWTLDLCVLATVVIVLFTFALCWFGSVCISWRGTKREKKGILLEAP